jgi:protoporphyrinogen oxidase
MSEICVLGSGMAAYGAAHALKEAGRRAVLFDKSDHFGGHTASHVHEGRYTFDEGPHISFTKDERIKQLFAEAVDGRYQVLDAKVNNFWQGHWIKHPAQVNLRGLPTDLIVKIVADFVAARQHPPAQVRNYEEWLRASFGNTFAETFPMQYTLKFHTTAAANLSTDWIGPRLYQASLEEILRGALESTTPDVHYIDAFRYPTTGGFVSYLRRFMEAADLHLGHEAVAIDPRRREVRFRNGVVAGYAGLVSSVPLPDLVPLIAGAPREVLEAAGRLACSELVLVNLVVDRPDLIASHWTYFYDREYTVTRLSTPHLQSPNNVPPGCGSLQAECYFSRKYKPLDRRPEACIQPVIDDMRRCGILRDGDRILFQDARHVPYANVIFDLERAEALATVHGFLEEVGIAWCGRYGDWAYIWTDESFQSGERAAQRTLARL